MLATDMTASGSPEEKLRWAFKMYDKDGSGCGLCPDCTVDVGVAIQVDINLGVIADRKASMLKLMLVLLRILLLMDAITQFMTKMAHVVSTDLSYRFDRAERDDRNHWHPLSDGGCSQGEQTASTKKMSIVKISIQIYKISVMPGICCRSSPVDLQHSRL